MRAFLQFYCEMSGNWFRCCGNCEDTRNISIWRTEGKLAEVASQTSCACRTNVEKSRPWHPRSPRDWGKDHEVYRWVAQPDGPYSIVSGSALPHLVSYPSCTIQCETQGLLCLHLESPWSLFGLIKKNTKVWLNFPGNSECVLKEQSKHIWKREIQGQ